MLKRDLSFRRLLSPFVAIVLAGLISAPTSAGGAAQSFLTFLQAEQADTAGLDGATSVAVSPDGRHVYVAGSHEDAVAVFGREATSGALRA